jgi:hypothetical protein
MFAPFDPEDADSSQEPFMYRIVKRLHITALERASEFAAGMLTAMGAAALVLAAALSGFALYP